MKKAILIVVALIVVIVGGAIYYAISNLDSIVKNIIEQEGTKVVGTPVRVGSVHIALKEGSATIKGLTVANPEGFTSGPAMSFGELAVAIDYGSGAIKRILADKPEFLFEQKGVATNFGELQKNIEKATRSEGGQAEAKPTEAAEKPAEEQVIQIDEFTIKDAALTVVSDQLKEPKKLTMNNMTFRNLKGTPSQVAEQALSQVVAKIVAVAAQQAIEDAVQDKAKGLLQDLFK